MTQLAILSPKERQQFDSSPTFSKAERSLYFGLDREIRNAIYAMKDPVTRAGFLLQLGYFKATARFFPTDKFKTRDINYVSNLQLR